MYYEGLGGDQMFCNCYCRMRLRPEHYQDLLEVATRTCSFLVGMANGHSG
jgi:hypothetical protein